MKTPWIAIAVLAVPSLARANVFDFKDLDGYKKCLRLDHLVETVNTADGAQHRLLSPGEIQQRCAASASKLLAQAKNKDMALAFVEATTQLSTYDNAVDLVRVLVDISLPSCNELAAYDVMVHPISEGYDSGPATPKAKLVIKSCLKDSAFRKDFLEEKDSGDKVRAKHACQILREEKLVKSCAS